MPRASPYPWFCAYPPPTSTPASRHVAQHTPTTPLLAPRLHTHIRACTHARTHALQSLQARHLTHDNPSLCTPPPSLRRCATSARRRRRNCAAWRLPSPASTPSCAPPPQRPPPPPHPPFPQGLESLQRGPRQRAGLLGGCGRRRLQSDRPPPVPAASTPATPAMVLRRCRCSTPPRGPGPGPSAPPARPLPSTHHREQWQARSSSTAWRKPPGCATWLYSGMPPLLRDRQQPPPPTPLRLPPRASKPLARRRAPGRRPPSAAARPLLLLLLPL